MITKGEKYSTIFSTASNIDGWNIKEYGIYTINDNIYWESLIDLTSNGKYGMIFTNVKQIVSAKPYVIYTNGIKDVTVFGNEFKMGE